MNAGTSQKVLSYAVIIVIAVFSVNTAWAQTYNWTGDAGDGDWDNPLNWDGFNGGVHICEVPQMHCDAINIENGDTVTKTGHLSIEGALDGSTTCVLTLDNSSTLTVTGNLWVADSDSGVKADIIVLNGSSFSTGAYMDFGNGADSVVNVTATNSTLSAGSNLKFANHGGSNVTAVLTNCTTTSGATMYMCDSGGSADVKIDGGTLDVTGGNLYVGDDTEASSVAVLTLTGGAAVTVSGYMTMPWDSDCTSSHVTVDGGSSLTVAGAINFGNDGGGSTDTVESRMFLIDGQVQTDNLSFQATDSKVVYTGGRLKVNNANMTEAEMIALIGTKIDVSGVPDYCICTRDSYTVLSVLLKGDFEPDCDVDLFDYAYFANYWLDTGCIPANNYCYGADLDQLGDVGLPDLSILIQNWLEN